MKKLVLSLFAIILISSASLAQNTVARAAISFKIKNLGISTDGTIGGLQATIHFNPADVTTATIEASADVNTLNTDNSMRDDHLKSDGFFDPAHYPKILLKAVSIKHNSGSKYTGQFNLTIKNKTKAVTIPFTYTGNGNLMAFNGSFKINRLDYGIGGNSLTLADEVVINIDASFNN